MSSEFDLIIFDLDGTLADTAPDIECAVNKAMADFDRPPVPHDQVLRAIGPGGKAFYRAIMGDDEDMALAEEIVTRYRHYYIQANTVRTRPFPGVTDMLDELGARGVKMAVASNKRQPQSEQIINGLGLAPHFLGVFGPEDVEHPKPQPDMLHLVMERAGATRGKTVMVGDTVNDMGAGRAAGVTTVFARWGYVAEEDIDPALIDLAIDAPAECVEIVVGRVRARGESVDR